MENPLPVSGDKTENTTTLKNLYKSKSKIFVSIILIVVIAVLTTLYFVKNRQTQTTNQKQTTPSGPYSIDNYLGSKLPSRAWMLYAMDIVRDKKPTPPESARLYAYVSNAYYSAKFLPTPIDPNLYTKIIIDKLYPDLKDITEKVASALGTKDDSVPIDLNPLPLVIRIESDGYNIKDAVIKQQTGLDFWKSDTAPFSPGAGEWQRWIITPGIWKNVVPPPLKADSKEYKAELQKVKIATETRDAKATADINFWGGVPGTESPAGIWQNQLFFETQEYNLSDDEYAYVQDVLAQTLADAFMETWALKYTYWTARPSMIDPTIQTAMKDPPFPAYVSGHSSISRAAAEVLGAFFPEKKSKFLDSAVRARDSRLNAGIHMPMDNNAGFTLGEEVGKEVLLMTQFTPITKSFNKPEAQKKSKDFVIGKGKFTVVEDGLSVIEKKTPTESGGLWSLQNLAINQLFLPQIQM